MPIVRAKRVACRVAAMLCQEDIDSGEMDLRYEGLKDAGGPSAEAVKVGMEELIKELLHRGRKAV